MNNVKINVKINSRLVMASLDINSFLAHIDEIRVFMSNTKKYGIVHLAISDHALVDMTHECSGARKIRTRIMKNFHNSGCLRNLQQKAWSDI